MATYKIIQDIEAEDHILGPLSFRQFVFALITAFLLYINFLVVVKGVPFLLIIFAPPALFFGFFALPFGRDQPTEIWALAKIRFFLMPRKRIWDQSGMKELVTITVPKKIEHVYTDGLSQTEVKSRLNALATTLDSRGWAVKNVVTDAAPAAVVSSDRLVDFNTEAQEVPSIDVNVSDDILDETNNPIAQQFDTMIDESAQARRQALMDKMNSTAKSTQTDIPPSTQASDGAQQTPNIDKQWFTEPLTGQNQSEPVVTPAAGTPTADEQEIVNNLRRKNAAQQASYSHLPTLQPASASQSPVDTSTSYASPTMTSTPDPDILTLANNNDLSVSTIARQANKSKGSGTDDEVVVSLH